MVFLSHTQNYNNFSPGSFFSLLGLGALFIGADGINASSPTPSTGTPLNSSSNSTFTAAVSRSPYIIKRKTTSKNKNIAYFRDSFNQQIAPPNQVNLKTVILTRS